LAASTTRSRSAASASSWARSKRCWRAIRPCRRRWCWCMRTRWSRTWRGRTRAPI